MRPPVPVNEAARLEALQQYEILDTPAEAAFDDIAQLAAHSCGTPTALVTLIDAKRQWFKSRFGFTPQETDRQLAFCAHTIAQGGVMVVPDALEDSRFADNILVVGEPRIRFYAGAPLITSDGHAIGSLAVIDYVPRQLDAAQLTALRTLANLVVTQLDLRRHLLTSRRWGMKAVRDREQWISTLFESAFDCIVVTDDRGRIRELNPAAERTFGHPRADAIGRDMAELFIPEPFRASVRDAAGEPGRRIEIAGRRANGTELFIELTMTRYEQDGTTILAAFIRDITEQHQSQLELRRSIERFELVSRATKDVIYDWNLRTQALWWSDSLQRNYGYAPHEIGAGIESWIERMHPDDRLAIDDSVHAAIANGSAHWSGEYRFRRSDGSYANVFDRGFITYDERGEPARMVGVLMDISERRRLEEQLLRSQKMQAIGQLSSGVAHDFNNLLTVIQCNAFMIERGMDADHLADSVHDILHATERAANLTRQLLLLGRKQRMREAPVNLDDLLTSLVRMFVRVIGAHIRLHCELGAKVPPILADVSMLEQLVLNLIVNARDAMPNGGDLTISTFTTTVAGPEIRAGFEVAPGDYAGIRVSDTGTGIDPTVLPNIFEPFFTTKEPGKGTGLGLSTVYSIAKQHGGWVEVTSVPGRGSTFSVAIPVAVGTGVVEPVVTAGALPHGTETLLVVEDEPLLRTRLVALLERCGYTVLDASSAAGAVEVFHEHPNIDLLLTDVVLPGGMTGRELAVRLHLEAPRLPVIFTSGNLPDAYQPGEPLVDGVNFLEKPYPPTKLLHLLRWRLDRK